MNELTTFTVPVEDFKQLDDMGKISCYEAVYKDLKFWFKCAGDAEREIKILQQRIGKFEMEDDVDTINYGAHMMAKQILKKIKYKISGAFSNSLANEIVEMYEYFQQQIKKLEREKSFLISCCKSGEKLSDNWEEDLIKIKENSNVYYSADHNCNYCYSHCGQKVCDEKNK